MCASEYVTVCLYVGCGTVILIRNSNYTVSISFSTLPVKVVSMIFSWSNDRDV